MDRQAFIPNGEPTPFVRASFSIVSDEEIDTALSRLASLIKETQQLPSLGSNL